MSSLRRLPFALLALSLLPPPPAAAESASPADIVLEKKVSPEKRRNDGRVHTVREGESISLILEGAGIPAGRLDEALPLLLERNPGLRNPDRIYVGQEIVLPDFPPTLFGPVKEAAARTATRAPGELPPLSALGEGGKLLGFLEKSFRELDESLRTSGTLTLPLSAPGILRIDNAEYPLLDLSTGRGIILDFDGRLSGERKRQIEERWNTYRVVSVPPEADFLSFLDRVFGASDFHSVARRQPLDLGGRGRIRLTPDFLLSKSPDSLLEGELYLIDVEPPGSEGLPDFIRESVDDHSMRLVEYFPGGDERRAPAISGAPARKLVASGAGLLLGELAPVLGLAVRAPFRYRAEEDGESGIEADLFLEGRGRSCLVFFDAPAADERAALDSGGVKYIVLGGDPPLGEVLKELLTIFGFEHRGPHVEFYLPNGRYSFTLDGFYLRGTEPPRFLATADLEEGAAAFLASRGIAVLQAGVRNGSGP